MSQITVHILDTASGKPAVDLKVSLFRADDMQVLATSQSDGDGRVKNLLADDAVLPPGSYCMRFDTGDYLRGLGLPVFYPKVEVYFSIAGDGQHYHIPLLLSPYGYTTYRGS